MNKHKRQLGFGAVEVILILIIIGLVGFVGWRVYEAQKQTVTPQPTTNHTEPPPSEAPVQDKYAAYTDPDFGYTFEYPKDWKTSDEMASRFESPESSTEYSITIESKDRTTTPEDIGYGYLASGAQLYASVEPTTLATPEAFFNRNGFLPAVAKDKKEVALDNSPGLSYRVSYESTNTLVTMTIRDGRVYSVILMYADEAALAAYEADYNALVASFRLPV